MTATHDELSPIPLWKLERFALGELPAEELARLHLRLETDAVLLAQVQALQSADAEIRKSYPTAWMTRQIQARTEAAGRKGQALSQRDPVRAWARWALVPVAAAALLAVSILFYVFIYTIWLKRRTSQNIVIGGAAGAFPPMIGWAAVTGSVGFESVLLFALIFFWTPPHFWALALYRRGDYEKAGIPMLPVVAGEAETKKQMLLYTVLLLPIAVAPAWFGVVGWIYGGVALVLGLVFLAAAISVYFDRTHRSAKRMFGYSIFYLFALFATMMADVPSGLAG